MVYCACKCQGNSSAILDLGSAKPRYGMQGSKSLGTDDVREIYMAAIHCIIWSREVKLNKITKNKSYMGNKLNRKKSSLGKIE